jgi:hypothetical protein
MGHIGENDAFSSSSIVMCVIIESVKLLQIHCPEMLGDRNIDTLTDRRVNEVCC